MTDYFRPLVEWGNLRPDGALGIAGGAGWASRFEHITRKGRGELVGVSDLPKEWVENLSAQRTPICGLALDRPQIMGVLNVTPDSFSDGGEYDALESAVKRGQAMLAEGADILDIGGESTRPGADFVDNRAEIDRVAPVIQALHEIAPNAVMSIDTRKADVAHAARIAGARLFNDVSALSFDENSKIAAPDFDAVCLMHASGDPKTMQDNPQYDHVSLDVYDYLAERVAFCEAEGIDRSKIIVDPGIGFGKTLEHNLRLIGDLSLFHGLGCSILLGVSRKKFIGTIGQAENAQKRAPGSIAVGLEGIRQGVQFLRVHDIWQTKQALDLWLAMAENE